MTAGSRIFDFEAELKRFPGKGGYFYLAFPHSVEQEFGTRSSLRVDAVVNGVRMDRALIPRGDGTHYLIMSKELRRKARIGLGDVVSVKLSRKADQAAVKIPAELKALMELEPEMARKFAKLTPGMRRGMCHWIGSGKREETRTKRAIELLRRMEGDEFIFGERRVRST